MKLKLLIILLFLTIFNNLIFGQKTRSYREIEYNFYTAKDLYEKSLYGSAQNIFEQIIKENIQSEKKFFYDEAAYYYALCALELYNGNAIYETQNYIETHPESYYINDATFKLANYYFRNKKFKEAIEFYQKTDQKKLSGLEISEYYFKLGFSFYARKDYVQATNNFYEVKDRKDNFGILSLYFYSHLKYVNSQYQTALVGFLELENVDQFKDIAPHYIIQIYYFQGEYETLIDYSKKFQDADGNSSQNISKLIAESNYKIGNYAEAIPLFKEYEKYAENLTVNDYYEMGFSYYKTEQYENAITYLSKIKKSKDTISQYVTYTMGDCYLKLDKKVEARRSFELASQYAYNEDISEDALFNFAQLSFELSISPFNEAVTAFTQYIEKYPNTARASKAYDFIINAFLSTKNYQQAIKTIDKMSAKTRNSKVDAAYQRLTYFRGLELFTEQKYSQAISMFNNSLKHDKYDKKIAALCHYWKAESNYRTNNVTEAIDQFKQFVTSTGSVSLDEYGQAHYNLGYAYFKKKDYKNANLWFRKYEDNEKNTQSTTLNDALNRIGDCFFISKEYKDAVKYYTKAANMGIIVKDYSLYQLGLSYGAIQEYDKKTTALKQLINEESDSEYGGSSMFEIAKTYQTFLNNTDSAKYYYNALLYNYPSFTMKKTVLTNIATLYFNDKNYEQALVQYKEIISQYPNSQEAKNASEMIKTIYIEQNKADEYIEYAKEEGAIITKNEEDEILWSAAKKFYVAQNYEDALSALKKYLNKIPDGLHKIEAIYYKAELDYYYQDFNSALECYKVVADASTNSYSEESTIRVATILFDQENWGLAYYYFNKLYDIAENKSNKFIATLGRLRSSYNGKDYEHVIISAQDLLKNPNANEEEKREANYKLAKAYLKENKNDDALLTYKKLANEVISFEGAEANFRVAELSFMNNKDSIAEEYCYQFIQSNSPHGYWSAKSYILLARIYYKQADVFSAQSTLETVINNYYTDTDGIKAEAQDILGKINSNVPFSEIEKSYKNGEYQTIEHDSNANISPDQNSSNSPATINE